MVRNTGGLMWQREPASVVICWCGCHLYIVSDLIYACVGFLVFVEILSGPHATNYRIWTPLVCSITALFCAWANSEPTFSPAYGEVF
jgi:hypothetical protein